MPPFPFRRGALAAAVVLAVSVVLTGGAAVADDVPAPPDSPGPFATSTDNGQFTFSWPAPAEHGASVTGYEVDASTDDQETWEDVNDLPDPADTSVTVEAPSAGSIVYYRVIAESSAGPSDPNVVADETRGTRTQRFRIVTAEGGPVTGADTIEWSDGYGTWSKELSLSPDGYVSIPDVSPTFGGLLRLSEGQLPGINFVVGKEWSVDLGTDTQTLVVPDPPATVARTVHLVMPDGTPVVGAEVNGGYQALVNSIEDSDGFAYSYYAPDGSTLGDGYTGADGSITLHGWPTETADWVDPPPNWPNEAVHVNYNDHVLRQSGDFLLTGDDTTITLNPMPFLSAPQPPTTSIGDLTAVRFTVHPAPAASMSSRSGRTSGTRNLSGVRVSLVPPATWTSKRCKHKSVLTGTSDSQGHVILRVCGAVSAPFGVSSSGAVPTGAVTMRVRHAAPAAPATVAAGSPAKGKLAMRWTPPRYTGAAPVTKYVLTLTADGHKTRTVTVPGTARSHTVDDLARAVIWQAAVRAVTKYHAGATATAVARVS